jgi:hypothetical protein
VIRLNNTVVVTFNDEPSWLYHIAYSLIAAWRFSTRTFERRGIVDVKGKGQMETWFLEGVK